MTALLDLKLVFVTGKGGVRQDDRRLRPGPPRVVSGPAGPHLRGRCQGDVAGFFEAPPTAFRESEILPGLFAMTMDTEASLREYLKLQLRIPVVGRIGPLAKAFDFVATAAPGVREILTVGKLCYEVRERNYDLVVVDARGDRSHRRAAGRAPGDQRSGQGRPHPLPDRLDARDPLRPSVTGLLAVCTPEEMPVNETIDLAARIRDETTVQLSGVVVNRVLPELFGRQEEAVFDALGATGPLAHLDSLVGGDAGPVLDAARLAVTMRRTRSTHLDRLRRGIDPSVPMLYLPYLFTRSHGLRTTRQVADSLGEELGD